MSVDGINVITGETANPQQSGYILAPGQPLDIKGWRKNMDRTAAFSGAPGVGTGASAVIVPMARGS